MPIPAESLAAKDGVGTCDTRSVLEPAQVGERRTEAIPLRPEPNDIRHLFASTMEVMRQQAQAKDVTIEVRVDPALPALVTFDTEKIAWAVTTLVGNALRHVRSGSRHLPGGAISVEVSRAGAAEMSIEVQDDGSGIPAAKLPFLFRRAPGLPHAAGLALMLIHDIVAAHGGSVDVKSSTEAFDHGTTVRLVLPLR